RARPAGRTAGDGAAAARRPDVPGGVGAGTGPRPADRADRRPRRGGGVTMVTSDRSLHRSTVKEGWELVVGLEVHVELNTTTKMWCGCSADFGAPPNTNVCPVCTGQPGALPVVNREAVRSAARLGLALNCGIAESCRFHRKNYFYPYL